MFELSSCVGEHGRPFRSDKLSFAEIFRPGACLLVLLLQTGTKVKFSVSTQWSGKGLVKCVIVDE